ASKSGRQSVSIADARDSDLTALVGPGLTLGLAADHGADLLARGEERLGDRAAHLSGDPGYCVHAYLLKVGCVRELRRHCVPVGREGRRDVALVPRKGGDRGAIFVVETDVQRVEI